MLAPLSMGRGRARAGAQSHSAPASLGKALDLLFLGFFVFKDVQTSLSLVGFARIN